MEAIKNFLNLINENWTIIITIVGLGIAIYKKVKAYISLSEEERINIAIAQIKSSMLELVTKAEKEYGKETGKIKRSKVLEEIYSKYPELKKFIEKEELEKTLDAIIDENLEILRNTLKNNKEFENLIYNK